MYTSADILSPLHSTIFSSTPTPAYARLVVPDAGEKTNTSAHLLDGITPQQLLTKPIRRVDEARALLAGLWLWFDNLDQSHRISQSIDSATGCFWHAIMHRREGDFSNAMYWYARCRQHPAMGAMPAKLEAILRVLPAARQTDSVRQVGGKGWDPDAFVDLVAQIHDRPDDPRHAAAVRLQRSEWQALFEHCARDAVGDPDAR